MQAEAQSQEWKLAPEHELRFEVDNGKTVYLTV
jgi:hypothetical protein